MLKNATREEEMTDVRKCGGHIGGGGSFGLATDSYYLSDQSDDALESLYALVHADYEKRAPQAASRRSLMEDTDYQPLQAELALLREFHKRGLKAPRVNDALTSAFAAITARVRKIDERVFKAKTQPDPYDEHVHSIDDLTEDGDGTTSEAGSPPHSHNVVGFMVLPVKIDKRESEHPGKVDVMLGKSSLKVTKANDDGTVEWEAKFDIIKKDEEQRLVGGIVYEPDVIDAQGDSASPSEILKACHNYMIKSQTIALMHDKKIEKRDVALVENFIAPVDYMEGTEFVRKGSWVVVHKVMSDKLWSEVKKGDYTGFSMAGKAIDVSRSSAFGKRDDSEVAMTKMERLNFFLKLDIDLSKRLRQIDGKWCVFAQDGIAKLGTHDTKDEALEQLRKILANPHKTPRHIVEKGSDYVTQEQMAGICKKCHVLMRRKHIHKVQLSTIMEKSKFKRMFGIRRSSKGHSGLCSRFSTDKKLFKQYIEDEASIKLDYNDVLKTCKACAREMRKRGINKVTVAAQAQLHNHVKKGGPGSGNFGHAGVPGQHGGSAPGDGGGGGSGKVGDKDKYGKIIISNEVANEGHQIAEEMLSSSNAWERASSNYYAIEDKQRSKPRNKELKAKLAEAKKIRDQKGDAYSASRDKDTAFKAKHGFSTIEAWEAKDGREWPHYRVNSNPKPPKYVSQSNAK